MNLQGLEDSRTLGNDLPCKGTYVLKVVKLYSASGLSQTPGSSNLGNLSMLFMGTSLHSHGPGGPKGPSKLQVAEKHTGEQPNSECLAHVLIARFP